MFGFVIGGLSLMGLYKLRRFERFHESGGPRRWMLHRVSEYLDATPGQEKVIQAALDDVEKAGRAARATMFDARAAYAQAVKGERFDGAAVDAAFEKQQAAVDEVKKAVKAGMASVHEALDEKQRAKAAEVIEHGPRAALHGGCGGRRHASA